MRSWQILIPAFCFIFSMNATAGELAYTCMVTHVYALSDNGALKTSGFEKDMKGSIFSVSRVTGQITGEVIPTLNAKSIRVVNKGTSENSFKTIAIFEGQVQILEVQEFHPRPIKPFIATSMGGAGVVCGTCQ